MTIEPNQFTALAEWLLDSGLGNDVVSEPVLHELTGYGNSMKRLKVLHDRGFWRAYINAAGKVVLEGPHYRAVCAGLAAGQRMPVVLGMGEEATKPKLKQKAEPLRAVGDVDQVKREADRVKREAAAKTRRDAERAARRTAGRV